MSVCFVLPDRHGYDVLLARYSEPPRIIYPSFAYIPPPSASLAESLIPTGAFCLIIFRQIVITPGPPSQASENNIPPGGIIWGRSL